jgi:ABC-type sugar transport system permease subunit
VGTGGKGWARALDLESVSGEARLAVVFVTPMLVVLAALVGGAVLYALFLSFHKLDVVGGQVRHLFVGLANYARFLDDRRLHQTVAQTLLYGFFRVAGVMVVSMALAVLLNQPLGGAAVLKRLFLIPWALSYVVNALVWGWIYNGNFGVLNALGLRLGLIDQYHVWLGEPRTAMAAIIFADVWKSVPFAALVLLAALQGVPRDLLEAATVDGATAWGRFRFVTLPWLRPVVLVLLVVETMWALKAFDVIWVLTRGGPLDRTMVLNVYAYQQTFQFFNFGYGAAVAYLITVLILGLTAVYFAAVRGFED